MQVRENEAATLVKTSESNQCGSDEKSLKV